MTMTHEEKLAKRRANRAAHKEEINARSRDRKALYKLHHREEYEAKREEKNERKKQRLAEKRIKFPKIYKVVRIGGSIHVVIPHKIAEELNIHAGDRVRIDNNYLGIIVNKVYNT